MTPDTILVVEDERAQREALVDYLSRRGYPVKATASGREALEALARGTFAAMVTDLRLPDLDGLEVIRRARELDEEIGVLLVTAYASVDSAVEALRLGAHDYLLKPLMMEEVEGKVGRLLLHRELLRDNARLRRALQSRSESTDIVAVSAAMQDVLGWARRASTSRATVLLTGETGVGKEVVAHAVHDLGVTAGRPFQAINLAALPDAMVEGELFGHERGAFTGADRRREGILRAAGDGTVLLDEIGEMSLGLQAKLLRALEAREVRPLGSDTTAPLEARVIAATHRDLKALVAEGKFREDLFYRLNVVHIQIPALRDRPEDVPPLVHTLVKRSASRWGVPAPVVSADAVRILAQHPWRGNVRELANVLERAMMLADEGRIEADHLPAEVTATAGPGLSLSEAVERFERAHIRMVLRLCEGNRDDAAKELEVSPATLYRRLDRLEIRDL